jgi:hypothetical protein
VDRGEEIVAAWMRGVQRRYGSCFQERYHVFRALLRSVVTPTYISELRGLNGRNEQAGIGLAFF